MLQTDDHKDNITRITIFRSEVIDECLGRHVEDTFLFPLWGINTQSTSDTKAGTHHS